MNPLPPNDVLLALTPPPPAFASTGALAIHVQGQTLWLLPDRAAYWVEQRTLLVADVHMGKAASFRALGVPVPSGTTEQNLRRLTALLQATGAQRLVVLGDWVHAHQAHGAEILRAAAAWREAHAAVDMVLVRGNHDAKAGALPDAWRFQIAEEPFHTPPFALHHAPREPGSPLASTFWFAGHVHPVVRLRGQGRDSARLPCFVLNQAGLLFPAFGEFTGGFDIGSPRQGAATRVYALSTRVHAL